MDREKDQPASEADKGPWWAQLLSRYGFATAVAVALLWVILGDVRADLGTIKSEVRSIRDEHNEMRFYLRAICHNAATTETARANCVPPSERR